MLPFAVSFAAPDFYSDYIDRYAPIAVAEQRAHGIPASITLAQGLLESAAGRSSLATKGNNHFGIKCHSTWTGDTLLRNDDAANECFRVYRSAAESFADHSRFLLGKRYRQLFDFDITDYT
ncbi:MAG: glucosaminidase domain-containing protein, partial [Muribaculaceae bacterium]|nr:glucosaminidase domain-containing protein [Muribaculaceae bacterium]